MEPELSFADLAAGLRRRRWMVIQLAALGTLVALVIALAWPSLYRASARVLVEGPQISAELARSTVTDTAAERLRMIEERLMAHATLVEIIDRLDLFAGHPWLSETEKVEALRAAASLQTITPGASRAARARASVSAFVISYQSADPHEAVRVTDEFVSRLLAQNLERRAAHAGETSAFFAREVSRLEHALAEIDRDISAFKAANEAALPESLEFRQLELLDLGERIFAREERRIALGEELARLQERLAGISAGRASPQTRELLEMRRRLAERQAVLSPRHPEIRALTAGLQALESAVAAPASGEEARRLEQRIAQLERQAALLADRDRDDRERQAALGASVEATPAVEMALARLIRRRADLEALHEAAVLKQAEAETGLTLERDRRSERFEVVEPARLPEKPVSPDRLMIATGGAAGSVALALALAFLVEFGGPGVRDAGTLERRLGYPPLASVPVIPGPRRGHLRLGLSALAIAIGLAAVLTAGQRQGSVLAPMGRHLVAEADFDIVRRALVARL